MWTKCILEKCEYIQNQKTNLRTRAFLNPKQKTAFLKVTKISGLSTTPFFRLIADRRNFAPIVALAFYQVIVTWHSDCDVHEK